MRHPYSFASLAALASLRPKARLSRTPLAAIVLATAATLACAPAPKAPTTPSVLPLRSIRFYDSGVGYFERSGSIGEAEQGLPVPAAHLDDALSTLVILGPDAAVSSLAFESSPSSGMARARARMPVDANTALGFRELLRAAKGERVELTHTGGVSVGRIVDVVDAPAPTVEPPKADAGDKAAPPLDEARFSVVLVGDDGALLRVHSRDVKSVKPLDPSFAAKVREALDASGSRAAQVRRLLRLAARGTGTVTLGYVAETPLWRASYRLVLGKTGETRLVGWALVHNDTDEDWTKVGITFVNGRPDSFLFPMAAPRYARRALVHPDEPLSTVPQLLAKTPDAMWGDNADEEGESFGLGGFGSAGGGGGYGVGYGHGSGRVVKGSGVSDSDLLEVGNLAAVTGATATEAGALFSYAPSAPVDLAAHASALVPFLSRPISAEPMTYFDGPNGTARTALRLLNDTEQSLPPGTMAVFGNGGFSGETALPRMKPAERVFLTYGQDLDVELETGKSAKTETPRRATFANDVLEEHFVRRTETLWKLKNRGPSARKVYVALSLNLNGKVEGADAADYDTAGGHPLAVLSIGPATKIEKNIITTEGLERRHPLASITPELLIALRDAPELPAAEKAVLSDAVTKERELANEKTALADAEKERAELEERLTRLREHLKAMGDKGGNGPNPLVTRILAAEDALGVASKKVAALELSTKSKRDALRDTLAKLTRAK
jgi:hypothetical protein